MKAKQTIERMAQEHIKANNLTPNTAAAYMRAVAIWIEATKQPVMERATSATAGKYAKRLRNDYGTSSTARLYWVLIRTLFQSAMYAKNVRSNPLDTIKTNFKPSTPRQGEGIEKALAPYELERMKAAACKRDDVRNAFLFACYTGMRLSDVETLTAAEVVPMGEGLAIVKVMKKASKRVTIPLSAEAIKYLPDTSGAGILFPLPSRMTINNTLHDWAEAANLGRVISFHTARHTFCTLVYNATGDIYVTKELAGHADISTTAKYYASVSGERLTAAVNAI